MLLAVYSLGMFTLFYQLIRRDRWLDYYRDNGKMDLLWRHIHSGPIWSYSNLPRGWPPRTKH